MRPLLLSCLLLLAAGTLPGGRGATEVPTSQVYTAFPIPLTMPGNPSLWPACVGTYALCSMANCTTIYPGREESDIGPQLAACGCITPGPENDLAPFGYVAPIFILDAAVQSETVAACGDGVDAPVAPACLEPNAGAAPICAAMSNNTIYGGAYDMVSAFQQSSMGAINTTCYPDAGWGLFANCMSAACVVGGPGGAPAAWDGSPITCFCPIQNGTAGQYQVGAPYGVPAEEMCAQQGRYMLSGKPLTS